MSLNLYQTVNGTTQSLTSVGALGDGTLWQTWRSDWLQGSTGTGLINGFLNLQATDTESATNLYRSGDTYGTGDANRAQTDLLAKNSVPVVTIHGVQYREFRLDLNEGNAASGAKAISLTGLDIYASNSSVATSFTGMTHVYALGGQVNFWDDNTGSGKGDIVVYIPESLFAGSGAYLYISTTLTGTEAQLPHFTPTRTTNCGQYQ